MAKTPPSPTAEAPKRGRGRPRKDPADLKPKPVPTGRPRGRPKGSGGVKKAAKAAPPAGTRSRGRPRKNPEAPPAAAAKPAPAPAKKTGAGRGRPRKTPVAEPEIDEEVVKKTAKKATTAPARGGPKGRGGRKSNVSVAEPEEEELGEGADGDEASEDDEVVGDVPEEDTRPQLESSRKEARGLIPGFLDRLWNSPRR